METYVARQPILLSDRSLFGYELLFRDGMSNAFPGIDGNTATSKLLTNSYLSIGMERLVGPYKGLINFTGDLLVKGIPQLFPKESLFVEVLEDVKPTRDVVIACAHLKKAGYTLALDDFFYRPGLEPLLGLSSIIKIDFRATPMDEVAALIQNLSRYDVEFLAEKVETYDEFQQAMDMGFVYFQGYFFSKPEIISGTDIPAFKLSYLRLLAEVSKPDVDFAALEKMIIQDVSISYKLLRYMNSAYFQRPSPISTIRDALTFLGAEEIRRFFMLLSAAEMASDKPISLVQNSIIRARFCEILGREARTAGQAGELFTLGLFSLIDAMLDKPMDEIMVDIPLNKALKDALVSGSGELGRVLSFVAAYEQGLWDVCAPIAQDLGVTSAQVAEWYMQSVEMADSITSASLC
ncbi:MAG: signal transduction protein [Deltaproteobacteria bacterium]|nr:MAG: signal transduction protein [Deltaproteobacteria bacterium]